MGYFTYCVKCKRLVKEFDGFGTMSCGHDPFKDTDDNIFSSTTDDFKWLREWNKNHPENQVTLDHFPKRINNKEGNKMGFGFGSSPKAQEELEGYKQRGYLKITKENMNQIKDIAEDILVHNGYGWCRGQPWDIDRYGYISNGQHSEREHILNCYYLPKKQDNSNKEKSISDEKEELSNKKLKVVEAINEYCKSKSLKIPINNNCTCGKILEKDFNYCPECGEQTNGSSILISLYKAFEAGLKEYNKKD